MYRELAYQLAGIIGFLLFTLFVRMIYVISDDYRWEKWKFQQLAKRARNEVRRNQRAMRYISPKANSRTWQ